MKDGDKESLNLALEAISDIMLLVTDTNISDHKHLNSIELNIKYIMEIFKYDVYSLNDEQHLSPSTRATFLGSPVHNQANLIRDSLVHGYYLIKPEDIIDFSKNYIPHLKTQIKDFLVGEYISKFNLLDSNLYNTIKLFDKSKEERSIDDRIKDMIKYADIIIELQGDIQNDKWLQYATQNCIEKFSEAIVNLNKNLDGKEVISEINKLGANISIKNYEELRKQSAHGLEGIDSSILNKEKLKMELISPTLKLYFEQKAPNISNKRISDLIELQEIAREKIKNLNEEIERLNKKEIEEWEKIKEQEKAKQDHNIPDINNNWVPVPTKSNQKKTLTSSLTIADQDRLAIKKEEVKQDYKMHSPDLKTSSFVPFTLNTKKASTSSSTVADQDRLAIEKEEVKQDHKMHSPDFKTSSFVPFTLNTKKASTSSSTVADQDRLAIKKEEVKQDHKMHSPDLESEEIQKNDLKFKRKISNLKTEANIEDLGNLSPSSVPSSFLKSHKSNEK